MKSLESDKFHFLVHRNPKVYQSNNQMSLCHNSRLCSLRSASDKTEEINGGKPEDILHRTIAYLSILLDRHIYCKQLKDLNTDANVSSKHVETSLRTEQSEREETSVFDQCSFTFPGLRACLDPNQLHGIPQTALSVLETLISDPQAYQWPVFEVRVETHQWLHLPQAFQLQRLCEYGFHGSKITAVLKLYN